MPIQLSGSLAITGSLLATSTITAQTLVVQTVTSSIVYSSGSNIFGNSVSNTQQFTGSLQVSGSNHYVLGNVGVGTTSPGVLLQVEPSQTVNLITSLFTRGNSDPNFRAGFANGSGSGTASEHAKVGMWYGTSGNPVTHIGFLRGNSSDSSGMTFNVNNTEYVRLDPSGNVGIGSASPAYKLDVNGAGYFNTGVLINGGSTFTAGELGFTNSASGAQFGIYTTGASSPGMFFDHRATSNTGLWTWRNGTGGANTRMVLTGDGNLGIGTTTPDIFGRGDGFDVGISSAGVGSTQNMSLQLNAGATAGRGAQLYMGQGGTRHFTISSNVTETSIGTTSNTPLRFVTCDSLERLRFTNTGIACFACQVCSPSSIIKGTINEQLVLDFVAGAGSYTHQSFRLCGANQYRLIGNTNGNFILRNDVISSDVLTFACAGGATFACSITADSLNINTSTVFVKANIADTLTATSIGSNYNPGILNIQNKSATNGNLSLIGFQDASQFINLAAMGAINETHAGSPNSVTGALAFYTKASGTGFISERMRITSGGVVLIGTTSNSSGSPTFYIQNKSGLVANIAGFNFSSTTTAENGNNNILSSGAYYNGSAVVATQTTATLYQQYNGEHLFYTNAGLTEGNSFSGTERMRITSGGNVGIGITSPSSYYSKELVISAIDQGGITIASTTTTGEQFLMFADGSSGADRYRGYVAYNHNGNYLYFASDAAERMRITSAGCVGINTNNPQSVLDVQNCINSSYDPTNTLVSNQWFRTSNPSTIACATSGIMFVAQGPSGGNGLATINGVTTSCGSMAITFGTRNASGAVTERMRLSSAGNVGIGITAPTSKLHVTGSTDAVIFEGSGSNIFAVDGTSGRLFSVDDDLTNSLFSVNTIAGLPVIEAFADNTVRLGTYSSVSGSTMMITGSVVAIGTTSTSTEANLYLGARGTSEGGQLVLQKGTSCSCATHLDNFQDRFRIMSGTNTTSTTELFSISMNGGEVTTYSRLSTIKQGGGGTYKQTVVGQITAASSGTAKKIAYVGHTHSVRVYVWANQSTGNGSSAIADITTLYGSSNGGTTTEANFGNVSDIVVTYDNGGSPAYTINVTLTYSGAAPTINYVIEGINNDNNIYTL